MDHGIFEVCFGLLHYEIKSTWLLQNNKGTKEAWKVILATVTENKNIDIYYSDKSESEEETRSIK
jgi:hypothetical protein